MSIDSNPTDRGRAKRLPDAYRKDPESNNWKLIALNEGAFADVKADIAAMEEALDMNIATGETLDLIGDSLLQHRGAMSDDQFRYIIRSRIARNFVGGDYESVLQSIRNVFLSPPQSIVLDDAGPGEVVITRLPFGELVKAGLSAYQAIELIEALLPVGVRVLAQNFEGTFTTVARYEPDDAAEKVGCSEAVPEEERTGGYLGFAFGEDENTPIPL